MNLFGFAHLQLSLLNEHLTTRLIVMVEAIANAFVICA